MDIRINEFCDHESPGKFALDTPWIVDDYCYATDGRIAARVLATEGDKQEAAKEENRVTEAERKRPRVEDIFVMYPAAEQWTAAATWPTESSESEHISEEDCNRCHGEGKEVQKCPSCNREGDHECRCDCGAHVSHECQHCDGIGVVLKEGAGPCPLCHGKEQLPRKLQFDGLTSRVDIAGWIWQTVLNCVGGDHSRAKWIQRDADSVWFRTDDGLEGVAMGLRNE